MSTKNLSKKDLNKAINQSTRGKIFSTICDAILLGASGFFVGKLMESASSYHGAPGQGSLAIMALGIALSSLFLSFDDNSRIIKLSMFGIQPNEKDIINYVEINKKSLQKRLQWLNTALISISNEKETIEKQLA